MAGGNFMYKLINYVVNEVVVNGLANRLHVSSVLPSTPLASRAFQRFAVRTSRRFEDVSKIAAEKKIDLTEQMKDFSKNMQETFKNQNR